MSNGKQGCLNYPTPLPGNPIPIPPIPQPGVENICVSSCSGDKVIFKTLDDCNKFCHNLPETNLCCPNCPSPFGALGALGCSICRVFAITSCELNCGINCS